MVLDAAGLSHTRGQEFGPPKTAPEKRESRGSQTMHQPRSRRRPKFNSVEEYLASLDPTKESTLRSVIDLILTQFPELESKISWNVPTIHRNGKYVVGVCAYKHHLTFSPWSSRVIGDFKVRLGRCPL